MEESLHGYTRGDSTQLADVSISGFEHQLRKVRINLLGALNSWWLFVMLIVIYLFIEMDVFLSVYWLYSLVGSSVAVWIVTVLCPNLPSQIQDKKTKIMLLVRVKS